MLTTLTNKRWVPLVATVLLVACDAAPPPGDGDGDRDPPFPTDADAGVCSGPREGCGCEATQAPVSCYEDPAVQEDGTLICGRGTRYCRDGSWTSCQSIAHYELTTAPGVAAINGGPGSCANPCDESCGVYSDTPDNGDLATNGTDLVFNAPVAEPSGVQLIPVAVTPDLGDDTDGDGVPDIADACPDDANAIADPCDGDAPFLYHPLPYGAVSNDPVIIDIEIRTADVYFLMDTTGSMQGALDNLKATLTTGTWAGSAGGCGVNQGIIGAIKCLVGGAWFGVGHYRDIPLGSYGDPADPIYENVLNISPDFQDAKAAVVHVADNIQAGGGNDGPESQLQAMYSVASGNPIPPYLTDPRGTTSGWTADSRNHEATTSCPTGTWGYPCFRDGTIPVIVHMTDEAFHNGWTAANNYAADAPGAISRAAAVGALVTNNVRIVTIFTGYIDASCFDSAFALALCASGDERLYDSLSLAYATSSTNGSSYPYFAYAPDGLGLTDAAVGEIQAIAEYNRYDIIAVPMDNVADTRVDDRGFIDNIVPTTVSGGSGCTGGTSQSGLTGTHHQCAPGTDVTFVVNFRNDVVPPMDVEQVFTFTIEVRGDNDFVLQTIPVSIVVPAVYLTYPADGVYFRDYDSVSGSINCAGNERPDWGDLTWNIPVLPTGTRVDWEFRTSDDESALGGVAPVTISTPGSISPLDVGNALEAAGVPNYLRYLRVSAVLRASTDLRETPRLQSFDLQYTCVPAE